MPKLPPVIDPVALRLVPVILVPIIAPFDVTVPAVRPLVTTAVVPTFNEPVTDVVLLVSAPSVVLPLTARLLACPVPLTVTPPLPKVNVEAAAVVVPPEIDDVWEPMLTPLPLVCIRLIEEVLPPGVPTVRLPLIVVRVLPIVVLVLLRLVFAEFTVTA